MKASAFSYVRVSSAAEALRLLAEHGDQARVLSGGQSLMPALNLRLSSPALIIDINDIPELRGVTVTGNVVRIGALTRHAELMTSTEIARHAPLLSQAVAHVAHPAIRNRGTIGGSLAQADPASELPACMLALDATIVVRGPGGERRVPGSQFFTGIYQTALTADELIIAVECPVATADSAHFFHEYARRAGDYAMVGLAASAARSSGALSQLRLGFFAVGDRPVLASAAKYLTEKPVTAAMLADAVGALDAELEPHDDQQATASMRRHLARQLLARCVATMLERPDLATRQPA